MLELTYGFQKGLAFDIAYGAANLDDGNARILVCKIAVKTAFNFVCNMRNHLHGTAAIVAAAFFLQNGPRSRSVSAPSSVTNTSPC